MFLDTFWLNLQNTEKRLERVRVLNSVFDFLITGGMSDAFPSVEEPDETDLPTVERAPARGDGVQEKVDVTVYAPQKTLDQFEAIGVDAMSKKECALECEMHSSRLGQLRG